MKNQTCKECDHFIQHYGLKKEKLYPIYLGHCCATRMRRRTPDAEACEHFVQRQEGDIYVTKEYLTKALLDRVLNMELFPEILELRKE